MAGAVKIKIVQNNITERVQKYLKAVGMNQKSGADFEAKKAVGIQAIEWVINGSPSVSRIPPIDAGALWASGSVFVGSTFVYKTTEPVSTPGVATPNMSHTAKPGVVTYGFNTPYAAKWHEIEFNPGEVSSNAGDVGTKYLEKHIQGDAMAYTELYAKKLKEVSGG